MQNYLEGAVAYPEDFAMRYREKGYWTGQNLSDFLQQSAEQFPENIAIFDAEIALNYQQFNQLVSVCATHLYQHGLRAGDKAVVQMPNCYQFYVLFFALIRLGALPIMSLPAHRYAELNSFFQQTQAKAYFCADMGAQKFDYRDLARKCKQANPALQHIFVLGDAAEFSDLAALLNKTDSLEQAIRPSSADQVAFLQLSGGSTGVPKLIPRTHDDYLYSVRESAKICRLEQSSRLLMVLPAAHNFSMSSAGALGIFYVGGAVILGSDPSAETAFNLIRKHGVTDACLVPALVQPWMDKASKDQDDILSTLRCLQVGGARLADTVASRLIDDFQVKLQQVFGMAEGLVNYTHFEMSSEQILHTQGLKISVDDEILVLDEHDQPVAAGEIGHLLTRGPYTIRGYYKAPEHNLRSFTPDGFYRTGDLVRIREDGCIVVEGRSKEQINRGGEKIATEEVEQALVTHAQVRLAALVAMPDEMLGEKSCAFIAWQMQDNDPSPIRRGMQLRQYLKDYGLATYKIPDRIEFIEQFPYTAFGKIDKKVLRQKVQSETV
ncbi:(2,3-dihydroxybenzoyl)adenylate synthase [Acinetobacter colistiniresistens]|uniref:AMP-binding protein n=1 Tax=Acinetobacter colistiniresistens TaxID=280145 RepID=A0A558F7S5_9GAMM|nr:AMP-binding protein [Acinetobacter colistiniresistens]TVT81655.1 AMP-binding protein [Acinetobacter colistiniresistens]